MSMYLSWWGTVSFLFYKQGHFAIFSISIFFERWSRADSSNAGDIYDMGSRTVILALQVRDLVLHQYYLTSLHPDIIFYINIIWHPLLTLFDILYFFFYISFHSSGTPWTFKQGEPTSTATLTISPCVWSFWQLSRNFKYTIEMKIQWPPDFLCEVFSCFLEMSNMKFRKIIDNLTFCVKLLAVV